MAIEVWREWIEQQANDVLLLLMMIVMVMWLMLMAEWKEPTSPRSGKDFAERWKGLPNASF
jgi:hypothetical protein